MFIKVRQKPPKDGWYEVEYDPKTPAIYKDNRRAFYNGKWRMGIYILHLTVGIVPSSLAVKATNTNFLVTNLFWSNK